MVSNLRIDGQVHNVLIVATENDSVYALDANNPTAGPRHNGVLWQASFIDPANGITPVPAQDVENNGVGPTYGITATPVIDRATKTIYVVSQEKEQPTDAGGPQYVQQFHALNLVNGKEKDGGPVTIGDTTLHPDGSFTNDTAISVPGTGAGSADGVVKFNALRQLPRMGLVLDMKVPGHPDGVVFTGSASDGDIDPYHGWLIGYDAKTLKMVTFFNTTPNGDFGGIWQGGGAPSVASNGDLILGTGNGTFDAFTTTTPPGPAAQGEGGFGLGSSGIHQSAAVSFAASIPSTGVSSTGLFFNGDTPTDQPLAPDVNQPLAGTGIDFTAGAEDPNGPDTFQATLSYSGTTLSETITDQTTGATFSRDYANVDLPATVGGDTAFVGFGGGTDGRQSTMAITSWTYSSGGQTLIDHSGGFASNSDLTATGVTNVQRHRGRPDHRGRPAGGKPLRQQPRQYPELLDDLHLPDSAAVEPDHADRRRPDLHHPERHRPPARPGLRRVVPPAQADPRDDDRRRLLHPVRRQGPGHRTTRTRPRPP